MSAAPADPTTNQSACTPATPAFSPVFHGAYALSGCSAPQILSYYQTCYGSNLNLAGCAAWQASNASCNNCLTVASDPATGDWGPFVVYPLVTVLNEAGCLAHVYRDGYLLCAEAMEDVQECVHAACDSQCLSATDANACFAAAEAGVCSSYAQNVEAQCQDLPSVCAVTSDEQTSFVSIASAFCS